MPVRLIVRRVKPTPGSQLALFTSYSYHAFITDRDGDPLNLEADHRRHAEIENSIRDPASSAGQALKYGVGLNHLPSAASPPTPPGWPCRSWRITWLAGQRASACVSNWQPPRPSDDASSPWPDASPARHAASRCIFPRAGPGKTSSAALSPNYASCQSHPDRAHGVCLSTGLPNHLPDLRQAGRSVTPGPIWPMISPVADAVARQNPLRVADTLSARPNPSGPTPCQPFPLPFIPRLTSRTASLQWIRA